MDKLPRPPPGGFPKHRPEIVLSPEQELGAVTAFMAALPQNVIPPDVDPTQPIDPQLVLDFDTRSPRAEEEVNNVVSDVWLRNPVVVFSKVKCLSFFPVAIFSAPRLRVFVYFCSLFLGPRVQTVSPISRELKSILDAMHIRPSPTIFGIDQRGGYPRMYCYPGTGPLTKAVSHPLADADVLIPLLFRLTDSSELPILLIGGKPVGSMDTIRELSSTGQLKALATHAGAVLDGAKKPRRGRR